MTVTITRAALFAAATLLTATTAHAAPPAPEFVAKAGASDLYEMKSSKLVLASTKNADVRKFANEMIADHTKSTAKVKAAAMKSGLHPKPPLLDAQQKSDIAALTAAKGSARDTLYVTQQKASHQAALDLMQDEANTGDKPALKTAAAGIVPVVQHHMEMLNSMPAA